MTTPDDIQPEIVDMWRHVLTHGHSTRLAMLPGSPRCAVCRMPTGGVGGLLLKPFGRGSSRKSPKLCNT